MRCSGPLLDRIDLQIEAPSITADVLRTTAVGETSAIVQARADLARGIQLARQGKPNALLTPKEIDQHCQPDAEGDGLPIVQMRALVHTAPTYLCQDKDGRPYALQLAYEPEINPEQPYRPWKAFLGDRHFAFLAEIDADIRYLPDIDIGQKSLLKADFNNCTNSSLSTDFNISFGGTGGDGIVYGNVGWCNPNGRPSGTHTQWVGLQVFSSNYSGQDAHTPVVAWFKSTLHGMGMFFGDQSSSACTNGQSASYNTRIEAFSAWQGYGPGETLRDPINPDLTRWTASGGSMTDTCGLPWQDGWYLPFSPDVEYAETLQAADSQWTEYSVLRNTGSGWQSFVSAVVRNVNFNSTPPMWPTGAPGAFDASANGVMVGSTKGTTSGSWIIGIRGLATGWF